MALRLTIPEQHDFQDPTLELDARRLQDWLGGLPVLNTGESLRMVLNALEPLNEQRLDIEQRLRLLAVYLPTAKRLYDTAEPGRLRQQPLSRQQRQATVDNVERLCLAMADGFKIVIMEWYEAGHAGLDAPQLGSVLRWAVQQLAAALVHSYRFYRPHPPELFLEMNQLYRLARHRGVFDQMQGDDKTAVQVSLSGIYQAVCMLALSDPFSLEEGQVDRYFHALLQYAPQARIVPGDSWQGLPEGRYFIDLKGDQPPRHCVFMEPPAGGDDPHILDARRALEQMHDTLARLKPERRAPRAEAGILRALLPEVTPRDKRRDRRSHDGRWIEVVIGLEAIGDWLSRYQRGEQAEVMSWQIRDSSAQGFRLGWDENGASLLQVGELVCVVEQGTEEDLSRFQLFIVRWLRNDRGEGTELGVERLVGVPNPVELRIPGDGGAESCPALFLPSDGAKKLPARLVAPQDVYKEGRHLLVQAGEREISVRCAHRVEQCPGFDCFEFTAGA